MDSLSTSLVTSHFLRADRPDIFVETNIHTGAEKIGGRVAGWLTFPFGSFDCRNLSLEF